MSSPKVTPAAIGKMDASLGAWARRCSMSVDDSAESAWEAEAKRVRSGVLLHSVDVPFHAGQFFDQLAVHLFYPLSIPVAFLGASNGWARLRNQHLLGTRMTLAMSVLPQALFAAMLLLSFAPDERLCGADEPDLCDALWVGRAVAWMLYAMRMLVVCCKYAYLTPEEYRTFLNQESRSVARAWQGQMQLLTAWAVIEPAVLHVEVDVAAQAQGVPHFAGLFVDMGSAEGAAELVQEAPEAALFRRAESSRVPATTLALVALSQRRDARRTQQRVFRAMGWASLGIALVLPVYRLAAFGRLHEGSAEAWALEALVFVSTWLQARIVLAFSLVGVMDSVRRWRALDYLGKAAVSPTHPLRLDNAINVRAWVYTRVVLQHLGGRYLKRIEVILGYSFVLLLCEIAALFALLVYASVHSESGDVPLGVAAPGALALVCSMCVVVGVLAGHTLYGSRANALAKKHGAVLAWLQLGVRKRLLGCEALSDETLEELRGADVMLDSARKMLAIHDRLSPVTLFGLRTSPALLRAILSMVMFALLFAYRLWVVLS